MEDASSFCAGSNPASLKTAPAAPARDRSSDDACRTSMWRARITAETDRNFHTVKMANPSGCAQQRKSIITGDDHRRPKSDTLLPAHDRVSQPHNHKQPTQH